MLMLSSPTLVRVGVVRPVELYSNRFHTVQAGNSVSLFSRKAVHDELSVQGDGSNPLSRYRLTSFASWHRVS